MDNSILKLENIKMHFGGVRAVDGITSTINRNEIFGIIGPNGSGKTTLVNVITGIYIPTEGKAIYEGKDITKIKLNNMTELGISRTFQNLCIFNAMTAIDNIVVGQHTKQKSRPFSSMFRTKKWKKSEKEVYDLAEHALEIVGLAENRSDFAGALPYGAQKRLEIARALVMKPKLLLLDEPTAGLNQVEAREIMTMIKSLQEELEITIILIEHNLEMMMEMSDRIMVMETGKDIALGTPVEIQSDPLVLRAYLGEEV